MAVTIYLPDGFKYLAASMLSTVVLTVVQGSVSMYYRKAAKILYPRVYAEKAEMDANPAAYKFNCAQRVHQNTLENIPAVLTVTALTAVTNPKFAAAGLATFTFGRILYSWGYIATGERYARGGVVGTLAQLSLLGGSIYTVFKLMTAA
ncbi:hypothetical protein BDV98DRAFT_570739 [Pterulicium gracile]|uniref:Membrane-associated proteins in eicosanoid and glutathione metabolism n=1 Tax=Pterulicium gracile TaxID=1884261 RepID=A0A5C3QMV2_9AGAR|nr:hypothetical protein BDV98DRAFT_570739 [Pterula gracilis]